MIDTALDCRWDAGGRDPDSHSATLRTYHQILWSKALPSGAHFHLDISGPKPFLVHRSELGEFHLTSDSITHTYASRPAIQPLVGQLSDDLQRFVVNRGWLIADCIVFPGKRIDGRNTINGARGMDPRIGDRFDLTLECIRRHYLGKANPLSAVLARYGSFFSLFRSFEGYVEFFLLQDLVSSSTGGVKFYLPFDEFARDPYPCGLQAYETYVRGIMEFSSNRAGRISKWLATRVG